MKRPGDRARVVPRTLTPLGAVSPIRIVSLLWPVSCSALQAASTIPRYADGDASTQPFRSLVRRRPGRRPKGTIDLNPKVHHERPIDVDPRTLYREEIERDTRTVRLDTSFGDVIKIREQFSVIRDAADEIIAITRNRGYDDITARRWARKQAAVLARTLARMNNKTPRKPGQ